MGQQESNDAAELFRLCADSIKILPGGQPPAEATWHICSRRPTLSAVNYVGTCHQCGATVYFSDNYPIEKKLCVPCAIQEAKAGNLKSYGTEDAVLRALRYLDQRNYNMKAKKLDKDSYQTPQSACPSCGYPADAVTPTGGKSRGPRAGDFSVCLNCGEITVFNKDLTRRLAELNDLLGLPPATARELTAAQDLIRKTRPLAHKH